MIYINPISSRKWSKLTLKQKHNYWFELYLDIETALIDEKNLDIDMGASLELIENETDDILSQIYGSLERQTSKAINILNSLRDVFNDRLVLQKDFHFLPPINDRQNAKLDIIIILDNLRSAFNVGAIVRTVECLQISQIFCCGHTPTPEHEKVKNTAMGAETHIDWKHFKKTEDAIEYAKSDGYVVYALETHEMAEIIYGVNYSEKTAIVVGNEALGISTTALEKCDHIISIPISGWKTSLNVATATAVVCFEIFRRRQHPVVSISNRLYIE
jgi:tRNA G18 (ribose-2'-O)-methylase SpoU